MFPLSFFFFLLPGLLCHRSVTYLLRSHRLSFIFHSIYVLRIVSSFKCTPCPARPFPWIRCPPFIFIHHPRRTPLSTPLSSPQILLSFSACALVFPAILQPLSSCASLRWGLPFCLLSPPSTSTRTLLHFPGLFPLPLPPFSEALPVRSLRLLFFLPFRCCFCYCLPTSEVLAHWVVLHLILAAPTLSALICISPIFLIVIRIRILLSPTVFLPAFLFHLMDHHSRSFSFYHLSYPTYFPAHLPSLLPSMHICASTFTPVHFCRDALFLLHFASL